ncbi:MAG: flagellin [Bryobacteraceae bacterium]
MQGIDLAANNFLAALSQVNTRINAASNQVSSGLRVSKVSDDPSAVSDILETRAQIAQTDRVVSNLSSVTAETNTAEQALESAVMMLQNVNQLGAQGSTGTQTPAQRQVVGQQIGSILDELVEVAATRCNGRYLFSGDSDQTAPYTLDAHQPNGVSVYAGAPATRQVMDASGTLMPISQSAQDIFDNAAPGSNVFAAVNALQTALANGPATNDPNYQADYDAQTAAIDTAMTSLSTATDHLNSSLSFYGEVQDRISSATDSANNLQLTQQTGLSNLQDADIATAATDLTQAETQQQAMMAAEAQLPKKPLFDYLG